MSPLEVAALIVSPFTLVGVAVVARGFIALARIGSVPLPPRPEDRDAR